MPFESFKDPNPLRITTIQIQGCDLETTEFLAEFLCQCLELPLSKWPTYCGPSNGFGDWAVPDVFFGAFINPVCLGHDIEWALCSNSFMAFLKANIRLAKNAWNFCKVQLKDRSWIIRSRAFCRCIVYGLSVTIPGRVFFHEMPDSTIDPLENPVVKDRLHKLVMAFYGIK